MIFVPSGDQAGLRQPSEVGSSFRPPHLGIGVLCVPLPSGPTSHSAPLRSVSPNTPENRIFVPSGDQLTPTPEFTWKAGGVICFRSLPSSLTTERCPTPSSS